MNCLQPRSRRLAALILGSLVLSMVAGQAIAAEGVARVQGADARVDRLAEGLVRMIPMGDVFDGESSKDPAWPVGADKLGKVSAERLACLRTELSSEGYRRSRRADAQAYVTRYPERLEADFKLLDDGAEVLVTRAMAGGIEAARKGEEFDPGVLLKDANEGQLLAFVTFLTDAKYAPLRELVGLGDAFDASRSSQENEDAGREVGTSIAAKAMFAGFAACDVSPATIL